MGMPPHNSDSSRLRRGGQGILVAAMLVAGPLSASPLLAAAPSPAEQPAEKTDGRADRQSFEQKIKGELAEWQKRFDEWTDRIGENDRLHHAWTMVQDRWRDLRQEAMAGWDDARQRFQTAYDDLKRKWREQTADTGEPNPKDNDGPR